MTCRPGPVGQLPLWASTSTRRSPNTAVLLRWHIMAGSRSPRAVTPVGVTICYYGELDPYSGVHRRAAASLDSLVRDLSLALLLHDYVIVPPGNFFEHPLTLPAFRRLAPFVRVGRLGTSTDDVGANARRYLAGRREAARAALPPVLADNRALGLWPASALSVMEREWSELLPEHWVVRRHLSSQLTTFRDIVLAGLTALEARHAEAQNVTRHVREALDRSHGRADRHVLLTSLGAAAGDSRLRLAAAVVVQQAFFAAGIAPYSKTLREPGGDTERPTELFMFPSAFDRLRASLQEVGGIVAPLPVDPALNVDLTSARLRTCGIDLAAVLGLPPERLLVLAESAAWRIARLGLRTAHLDARLLRAGVAPVLSERPRVHALAGGKVELPPAATLPPHVIDAMLVVGPWRHDDDGTARWVLDLLSGELIDRTTSSRRALPRGQARLLAVIAMGDEHGAARAEMLAALAPTRRRAHHSAEERTRRGDMTLRTLLARLRGMLEEVGLTLVSQPQGRTVLQCPGGRLALQGVAAAREQRPPSDAPSTCTPTERRAYEALRRAWPGSVAVEALRTVVGSRSLKALERGVLYKLRRHLQEGGATFTIDGRGGSGYRLVPASR